MSSLQHDRIDELCRQERRSAVTDLYVPSPGARPTKEDPPRPTFLEDLLKAERAGASLPSSRYADAGRRLSRPSRRWRRSTSGSPRRPAPRSRNWPR